METNSRATRHPAQMTLTPKEFEVLDARRYSDVRLQGQREAQVKLEKAFRRLWKFSWCGSLALTDAQELVSGDFLYLFECENLIRYCKEAPPYMVVLQRETAEPKAKPKPAHGDHEIGERPFECTPCFAAQAFRRY